jgi:small subunit ribosomal protein S9
MAKAIHKPHAAKSRYIEAVGRRKTAVARVRLTKGSGALVVNDLPYDKYFTVLRHQTAVRAPLREAKEEEAFDVRVKVKGGGPTGQAEAVRHGIARALVLSSPALTKRLRQAGFLTRDPRMVERKKYGLKKARRAPQWSKR